MNMQRIITPDEARKITGGRKPLVPIEYETAVKALTACLTINEAKYWSDKSDALAAWAKIYRNDEVGRQARMLKLHAFRRMALIAAELRPRKWRKGADNKRSGSSSGARSLLIEKGLSVSDSVAATHLGRLPQNIFESLIVRPRPPTPNQVRSEYAFRESSEAYRRLVSSGSIEATCSFCLNNKAADIARALTESEADKLRITARRIAEWMDEFDQHLPKEQKQP